MRLSSVSKIKTTDSKAAQSCLIVSLYYFSHSFAIRMKLLGMIAHLFHTLKASVTSVAHIEALLMR
jgi:hypothetical protein